MHGAQGIRLAIFLHREAAYQTKSANRLCVRMLSAIPYYETLLFLTGCILIGGVAVDSFLTMLGMRGGGPLTNWWTSWFWEGMLCLHRKKPVHGVLTLAGPLMMVLSVLLWYLALKIGWWLIFVSGNLPVIDNSTSKPIFDPWSLFYFTGVTASGLGYGDYVPEGRAARWASVSSAFTATFLLTISLSYLMPVVSAALAKRRLARNIRSLGANVREIVAHSWADDNGDFANTWWGNVFEQVTLHSEQHLIYPVLRFFHSDAPYSSTSLAVLSLADSVFLISNCSDEKKRPPESFFKVGESAFQRYAQLRKFEKAGAKSNRGQVQTEEGAPGLDLLRTLGISTVSEARYQDNLQSYRALREDLIAICREDGWSIEECAEEARERS